MKEKNIGNNLISKMLFLGFIIASSILLEGCFGSPDASPEAEATAKKFENTPDSAVVYIYYAFSRPANAVSALKPHSLYLDDSLFVGKFDLESFFRLVINPGVHKLSVESNTLSFKADSGKIYFVGMQEERDRFGNWSPELFMQTVDSVSKSKIRGYNLLKAGVK